jgi:hypothetical protein
MFLKRLFPIILAAALLFVAPVAPLAAQDDGPPEVTLATDRVLDAVTATPATPVDLSNLDIPALVQDWTQLVPIVLAFLLPLILGWLKKQVLREVVQPDGSVVLVLPKWFPKWAPHVLGPVLLILADLVTRLSGGPGVSPWMLALLLPVATWLREVGDQAKKVFTGQVHRVVSLVAPGPGLVPNDPRVADRPLPPTATGESNR